MRNGTPEDIERLEIALSRVAVPPGILIRTWKQADFQAIQQLAMAEGWDTSRERPGDMLSAWHHSWPSLVAVTEQGEIVGFLRALSDGKVTTYVAELLVAQDWRGQGIGGALLDVCHHTYPNTRLDLLSSELTDSFYESQGFLPCTGFRRSYL